MESGVKNGVRKSGIWRAKLSIYIAVGRLEDQVFVYYQEFYQNATGLGQVMGKEGLFS